MRALLLALSALLAALRAENQEAIRCAAQACFSLYAQRVSFDQANASCNNKGGHLLTMRDKEEVKDAKALLEVTSDAGFLASGRERLWIGLKLSKGSCVLDQERLRGFHWVEGKTDSRGFANWGREPQSTCTEERCVSVGAADASAPLDWSDGSCKEEALYACRFPFKGMCEPLTLEGPGTVTYTVPFSHTSLKGGDAMPYGTVADISCTGSDENPYSLCSEAGAGRGFAWNEEGPFCATGERSCFQHNGGCSHVCSHDEAGRVRCFCPVGYYLGKDTFKCQPQDACRKAPCEHKCVVVGADFRCACHEGFQLAQDEIGCVDVDECELDMCGGHICHNRPGSYACECKRGFRKDAGGECEDIDECAGGECGENARCLNSQGSFSCYCATGFRSSEVGGECVDVDECLSRPCEHVCANAMGSYECSCRANFRLDDNGISCVQVFDPSPHPSAADEGVYTRLNQPTTTTAVAPVLTSESSSSDAAGGSELRESLARSWVWVWVLASVVPLLLLVALTSVIVALRWNRSRKDAKTKSPTADSYCWVSSGFQVQPDTEAR